MVADGAGDEGVAVEHGHVGQPGEVEHHVGPVFERVGLDDFGGNDALHPGAQCVVAGCAHVACLVARADEVGGAGRVAAVGRDAAVDQFFRFGHAGGGQAHGRADFVDIEGARHAAVEIRTGPGRLAAAGAPGGIEAEGKGGGDRHAVDAVGLRPGQCVGLNLFGGLAVDAALEVDEFLAGERAAPRLESHVDQVGGGNAAPVAVIGSDGDAVGVVVVDDHAQLVGAEGGLRKVGDDRFGRRGVCRSLHQQRCEKAAQKRHAHHARDCTHSRTSAGPR